MSQPIRNEYRTAAFVQGALPGIIAGRTSLSAAFISYRLIGDYRDGLVATGKEGLRILVATGAEADLTVAPRGMAILARGTLKDHQDFLAQSDADGARDLHTAQSKVSDPEKNDLAVVYLGLTAFDQSLNMVRSIRSASPTIQIVTVTCDCDLYDKRAKVAALVESGSISHFVVAQDCGGYVSMGNIIETMIDLWPGESDKSAV